METTEHTVHTVYSAARTLGVSSQWVRTLLAEGKLEGARKVDGQWVIPASALEDKLRRREVSA